MSRGPIVVGTDGSGRATIAVDRAGELGHALGLEVHVVCAPAHLAGQDWPPRITAQDIVAQAQENLRGRGVTVQTHIPAGDAAQSLVSVAEQVQAQMIVMGNRGMTGIRRLLGSLPNRVSHEARCDVMIVPTQTREGEDYAGRAVVVGADDSSAARHLVEEGIRLARALRSELHVVAVVSSPDASEAALAHHAGEQGVRAHAHALNGDPAETILSVAEDVNAAIIVVGSKGMHVEDRSWFGNVADKLSHDGSVSVLIVSGEDGEGAGAAGPVGAHAGAG